MTYLDNPTPEEVTAKDADTPVKYTLDTTTIEDGHLSLKNYLERFGYLEFAEKVEAQRQADLEAISHHFAIPVKDLERW